MDSGIDTVLLKVASRCNINCSYCYVYHMGDDNWKRNPKFMSRDTIVASAEQLGQIANNQGYKFSIVLHGGEPFLLGSSGLDFLLKTLREYLDGGFTISIQTNGVLITKEILDICSIYKVSVAVSIDGPKHVHDKSRIGHNGKGSFEQVLEGIKILKSHRDSEFLFAGLLSVIDPESDPVEVYQFFKEIGCPSVDFLYRDGNHSKLPDGKISFHSTEYGRWMSVLLSEYLKDETPIKIRVLDDMLKVLLGGSVSKEGMGLTDFGIIIVDTDGTITKNDTLKSSFNGADRFLSTINIKDRNLNDFLESKEFADYKQIQRPSSNLCLSCEFLNVCGGGMVLNRWKDGSSFDNPSIYCEDQKLLTRSMIDYLKQYKIHEE